MNGRGINRPGEVSIRPKLGEIGHGEIKHKKSDQGQDQGYRHKEERLLCNASCGRFCHVEHGCGVPRRRYHGQRPQERAAQDLIPGAEGQQPEYLFHLWRCTP